MSFEAALVCILALALITGFHIWNESRGQARSKAIDLQEEAEHRLRMKRLRLECRRHRVEMEHGAELHALRMSQK